MEFNKYFDYTLLKPQATLPEIEKLCSEAARYGFASVCVNPAYVKQAKEFLKGTDVAVCTVIGFPLGASAPAVKAFEAAQAVRDGATEIDMVIAIGPLKDKQDDYVEAEIRLVKEYCQGNILKVIIENCLLTAEEKVRACRLCVAAGADFVKTSTGFSSGGANVEDVILMKAAVAGKAKIKAAGGIRDKETAMAMIKAGADRIGTSKIITEDTL